MNDILNKLHEAAASPRAQMDGYLAQGKKIVLCAPVYTPEEIIGKLAYLAGQNPGGGPRTPEALAEDFHWDAVPRRDIPLPEGLF